MSALYLKANSLKVRICFTPLGSFVVHGAEYSRSPINVHQPEMNAQS